MHNPIVIRRANIRGKRLEQKPQEIPAVETAVALSDLPESAPMQPLDPPPATGQAVPHPPRKRKPYGLAIAATMLVFTPFLYAVGLTALMLIFSDGTRWDVVIGMTLLGSVFSNIGSILLYLAARACNYIRKPVALVSLELLVLQIGSFMICREDLAIILPTQDLQHPLLTIALISLILLCMIMLCVFCVRMLVHLLPKKPAKNPKA